MARYTESVRARARQLYETTDQPLRSIAAELAIGENTLQRLKIKDGWARRCERVRGLPIAVQLLEEAKALAALASPPPERGRSDCEAVRVGVEPIETPTPTLPLAGGGSQSAIDRIEALVVNAIASEEAAKAQFVGQRRSPTASERSSRNLATLTQTLRNLQQIRTGKPLEPEMNDDDMPRDLDEFRRELARRIAAFMESRPDDGDADEGRDDARLDDVS